MDDDADGLLSILHRGSDWAYLWSDYADSPQAHGTSLWYRPTGGIPTAPEEWQAVYFGVHGCHSPGEPWERAGKGGARLAAANCLYCDLDGKAHPGGVDAILADLERLPAQGLIYPTAIVLSGGGVHGYWIFDRPVNLRAGNNRASMTRAQRLWVDQVIVADPSAKDLSRVLRMPGSVNHKYDPPRPVEILEFDPDRTYSLQTIGAILEPFIMLEETQQRHTVAAPTTSQPGSWQRLIKWAYQDASIRGRHATGLRLSYRLKEAGCPKMIAAEVVGRFLSETVTDRTIHGESDRMVSYVYT